ncbi:hypothetical protein, partial [Lactobacillus jensenii]|uniref:hypothetical protein n=1 Tax=Lactobacillus jensenii TaxID=109790 RepID=UPI0028708B3D
VKTSRARNKIRRFLKEQRKDENIAKGRNDVANLLRERGLSAKEYLAKDHIQKLLNQLNYHSEDEMFSQVG